MRTGFLALLFAALLGVGLLSSPAAEAAPLAPGLAATAEAAVTPPVETVRWRCNANRCWWDPSWRGPPPAWGGGWGPPRHRSCYWNRVRGPGGHWRWVQVCPRGRW